MLPNHQIFVTSCVKKLQCDPLWCWNFHILFWNTKWMLLRIGWWWWCFFWSWSDTMSIMLHENHATLSFQHLYVSPSYFSPTYIPGSYNHPPHHLYIYLYHPPLPTLNSPTFPLPGAWWVDIQVCEVAAAVGVRPQCGPEIWIYHLFRNL